MTLLPQPLLVLSDGTGETAEQVVRAGLRQFRGHLVHVRTYAHLKERAEVRKLFQQAARSAAMIVSTLVTPALRDEAERWAKKTRVRYIDLLGALITGLEGFLDGSAVGVAGLLHQADEDYFRRVEAVEFTVKADDGKEPRMLRKADVILVGVSRTSKTPLSTFLAHKGFKVGNVPIVLDHPPPRELALADQRRVFALTIDPATLRNIRDARLRTLGAPGRSNYGDPDYILAELEYAQELFQAHPEWPVIDVTGRALEETAGIILRIYQERGFESDDREASQL